MTIWDWICVVIALDLGFVAGHLLGRAHKEPPNANDEIDWKAGTGVP